MIIAIVILAPFTTLGLLLCAEELRLYCIKKGWDFLKSEKEKEK